MWRTRSRPASFDLPYDVLVVAVGAEVNTFNVPGVAQHAHFLKEIKDARRIRVAVSDCFESAATPGQSAAERRRLLNFVIVGGGPTGIELGGELLDLIEQDLKKVFPREAAEAKIVIVEAMGSILNTYDRCAARLPVMSLMRAQSHRTVHGAALPALGHLADDQLRGEGGQGGRRDG